MNRRDATRLIVLGFPALALTACELKQSPTAPGSSFRLEPWGTEVSGLNGTQGILVYHDYADGEMKLLDALRRAGLDPRLREKQTYGNTTFEVGSNMTEFGWTLLVQNNRIGDANVVALSRDHLWAAYRKLSVG